MEKKTDSKGHQRARVQRLVTGKLFVDYGSFHVRDDKNTLVPFLSLVTSTMSKHIL